MKRFIGISLIFCKRNKSKFKAVQSSYIFEFKSLNLLLKDIDDKAKEITNEFLKGFDFLGVSDVYITESFGVCNYLGRTSFFDMKREDQVQEIIISEDEINQKVNEIVENDLINIGFVYFNKDNEGSKFNSVIIVYTIIDKFLSMKELCEVAENNCFKSKIIKFSIEKLRVEDLIFKGISDFYPLKNQGLFEMEGIFDSEKEIIAGLLSNEKLERELNEIKNDYKYIG